MSNCSNPDNKLLKDTSDVIYNSTPLPCTNVSPYDTLNTILTKFDIKICEIEESVSTLGDNITNLTEDVMVITEDILAINSRLDICCTTTTTTQEPIIRFMVGRISSFCCIPPCDLPSATYLYMTQSCYDNLTIDCDAEQGGPSGPNAPANGYFKIGDTQVHYTDGVLDEIGCI